MSDVPIEKKFAVLCQIVRAQHFAWREAVRALHPDDDPTVAVDRMWRETGHQTARTYLPRIDPSEPVAPQVAASIAWSSQCMGEDASVEAGEGSPADQAFVRHTGCPWFDMHERLGLLAEDRPGCDEWFGTIVEDVNAELGTRLRFETLSALPEGGSSCLRRLWVEERTREGAGEG